MVATMQAAVEELPEELPTTPRTFRRLLRRPGRRQLLLGCLPLIFALSLGLSLQVYTRRTRPHRLSVWGWGSKGRSRPTSDAELEMAVVAMNTSACEWEGGTDYLDQLPARRHFWGSWSRVPVRSEPQNMCPSHTGPALKTAAYSRRRRYTRQRPLDVNRWTCAHVAQWLGEQRWHWSELSQYQSRICSVGVDGATLYFVDEYDLEQDLQIGYRLHRKLVLDAIGSLKEQQPDGTAEPGNLWEYIHDDPTTAALYVSGVLCTPRLTMLWLHTFEYNTTLGPLLADEDESNDQVAYHAPRSIQEFLVLFPIRANKILFWIGWLCCPALMVAYHALRCAEINLLVSAYVIAISISKQFTEWHSLCETLLRTQMSISDKLASWVCSHLMTPALSMMLAVLHLVFSQVMPAWACNALFWVRIFVLPPLSIWASWASWVPLPPASEEGDVFTPGPTAGPNRRQRTNGSFPGGHITPACFWPEPLSIPAELDDCPDVPASFRCPITYEIMREPAIALSGHTYEREAIVTWLSGLQAHADPVTKAPIDPGQIAPNLALRSVILDWLWRNFNVRGTPHAAYSISGCNAATPLSAAGPSTHPLHGIMHVPLAYSGSPACSLRGSFYNSSASGVWGSSTAHHSTPGAAGTDSAAQNPSGTATPAGVANAASAGTSAELTPGPFAASVDDLLIRSASDGALHLPSGFAGSMHALLHECSCLKCREPSFIPHTVGSCGHLAGTAQLPTGSREILQDSVLAHPTWHGQPGTPVYRESTLRFGCGAKAHSCASASDQSMWSCDVCHGSASYSSASTSPPSPTSMIGSGFAGGGSSPAELAELAASAVPCCSRDMAVNSCSDQGLDSTSKRASPQLQQCTETCASYSRCCDAASSPHSHSHDGDTDVLASSAPVGLRCRIPRLHAATTSSLPTPALGGHRAGAADTEFAPFSPFTMPAAGNLRCLGRSSVSTPLAGRARVHASPHEDACEHLSKSLEHAQHPRARSETSRNNTPGGNMQFLLQQQAQAATASGVGSGLLASPGFMRFSAPSGFGNDGCSPGLRHTIRSQPPFRGMSPRQTSNAPCMTCIPRTVASAVSTSSDPPLLSNLERCHGGSRQDVHSASGPG